MKLHPILPALLFPVFAHAGDLPTVMTTRGKLLVDEKFDHPFAPSAGPVNSFASGFKAWRYNVAARGGHWEVKDGTWTGVENPAAKHPATTSYGFDFKNVVIQCELRMNDVPLEGRAARFMAVRTTDAKDYVCSITIKETGFRISKDDNDHGGPDKPVPLGESKAPLKLGEWHTVVFEILGEEMVGTVDGISLTGTHQLIGTEKCSVMFVAGVEGSVRNFKVWEALPNPDWGTNKAKLAPIK